MNIKALLTLVLHLLAPLARAHEFAPGEYESIRDVSLEVLERFPPSEYFYVGLGRSPTPITAFIAESFPGSTVTIPLSSISTQEPRLGRLLGDPGHLRKKLYDAIARHFGRFMPGRARRGAKKLLLIDFVYRGDSIVMTDWHLRKYLASACPECKLESLAILGNPSKVDPGMRHPDPRDALRQRAIQHVSIEKHPGLNEAVMKQKYDVFSEAAKFDPLEHILAGRSPDEVSQAHHANPNPAAAEFRASMRERIQADGELDQLLEKRGIAYYPLPPERAGCLARELKIIR